MAKLIYGSKVEVDLDDRSAFHLDLLLSQLNVRGAAFQLHLTPGRDKDGLTLSLTIAPGVPLALEFIHDPDLVVDTGLLGEAMGQVLRLGNLTLPFAFEGDADGIVFA